MDIQHLSPNELAKRWRISPLTLEKWRYQGLGPRYIKLGGRVIYRLEDVETHETSHTHNSTSEPVRAVGGEV